ncbi:hypothetical protein K2173_027172 [Erythroxylum novogranatense]|uniref:Uncharacterized protein n=1 Tax=Erythroxylum novogranatense TaxID=1862640 RepID=A0AAV8U0V3_9ROSI|nr:hypothetical protein K2173_027172 [Erythroxylum novogranatense]
MQSVEVAVRAWEKSSVRWWERWLLLVEVGRKRKKPVQSLYPTMLRQTRKSRSNNQLMFGTFSKQSSNLLGSKKRTTSVSRKVA